MQHSEDIEQELQQEVDIELLEAEQFERQLEENSQRMILQQEHQTSNHEVMDIQGALKPVKNPISPYMVFVSQWKVKHPEEKFSVSAMGEIWKSMGLPEKQPFETQYKERRKQYEEYQAAYLLENPNAQAKDVTSKYLFPLQRIKTIMKQDPNYAPKTDAVTTMSKATEYFGDFLLEEVKRIGEGKNRVDYKLLYDCINNVRSLDFLECLIQEHNKEHTEVKQKKIERNQDKPHVISSNLKKQAKPVVKKTNQARPSGQTSLDLFVNKQR